VSKVGENASPAVAPQLVKPVATPPTALWQWSTFMCGLCGLPRSITGRKRRGTGARMLWVCAGCHAEGAKR